MARTSYRRRRPTRTRNYKRRTGNTYPRRPRRRGRLASTNRIKRVVRRMMETKYTKFAINDREIYNLIDGSTVQSIVPVIAKGTGEADRIGNVVTLTKVILRVNIYPNLENTYGDEETVYDFHIFNLRRSIVVGLTDMEKFKDNGNLSVAFDGRTLNALLPVNNERFQNRYFKRFKMNGTSQTNTPLFSSVPRSKQFSLDITKYYNKKIIFDDNTNSPENCGLYVTCGAHNPYYPAGLPTTLFAYMDYSVHFYYKDA